MLFFKWVTFRHAIGCRHFKLRFLCVAFVAEKLRQRKISGMTAALVGMYKFNWLPSLPVLPVTAARREAASGQGDSGRGFNSLRPVIVNFPQPFAGVSFAGQPVSEDVSSITHRIQRHLPKSGKTWLAIIGKPLVAKGLFPFE